MKDIEILEFAEKIINTNEFTLIGFNGKKRFPNIAALKLMKKDKLKKLYFNTKYNSEKIKQIKKHKKGCLYFYDMVTFTFNNVLLEGIFKIEKNLSNGISNFYNSENAPDDLCTLIFETKKIYLYVPNTKYIVDIRKVKEY